MFGRALVDIWEGGVGECGEGGPGIDNLCEMRLHRLQLFTIHTHNHERYTKTHTYARTYTDTYTRTYTDTYTCTYTDTYTRTYTDTYTRTYTDTYTRTYTDTYTRTYTDITRQYRWCLCMYLNVKRNDIHSQHLTIYKYA